MKLGIVISTAEPETVFNAIRLGNFALGRKDEAKIFLVAKGVELDHIESETFDVRGQAKAFLDAGGTIMACGTCLKLRKSSGSDLCPLSTMKDLYELVASSDRVVTF